MPKPIRLDKFLSDSGLGTRSQVKILLKKGAVTVNGRSVKKPETKIFPDADTVTCQGNPVTFCSELYLLFHKPAGCITATEDSRKKTVLDYIDHPQKNSLFPVGRLDLDTEGLLLLTNNGAVCHYLLSPRKHVAKTYYAQVLGTVLPDHIKLFSEGVDIGDDKPTLPSKLEILQSGPQSEILLTITEGRYHQVKRMCESIGCKVTYLKRLRMGPLFLDDSLPPGKWRLLTEDEITALKTACGFSSSDS